MQSKIKGLNGAKLAGRSIAAGTIVAALALTGCAGSEDSGSAGGDGDFSGRQLVYASYGGATEDAIKESKGVPFEEQTGAEVTWVSPVDLGKVRAMVQSNNPEWDLVNAGFQVSDAPGSEDLFEAIDPSDFNTDDLIDGTVRPHGVGTYVLSYLVASRTDRGHDTPKTWTEFYDTKKFPGKRGMDGEGPGVILESALLADGVTPEDLYPLDVERAFKKLDTIKDDILWYDSGAQQVELMANSTVDYLLAWSGRAFDLHARGIPMDISFDQQIMTITNQSIVKGSPNADLALEFIKENLDPERQAKFAELTAYAPVNKKALDLIDPETAKFMPTYPENLEKAVPLDVDYWTEHQDELQERFLSWKLE